MTVRLHQGHTHRIKLPIAYRFSVAYRFEHIKRLRETLAIDSVSSAIEKERKKKTSSSDKFHSSTSKESLSKDPPMRWDLIDSHDSRDGCKWKISDRERGTIARNGPCRSKGGHVREPYWFQRQFTIVGFLRLRSLPEPASPRLCTRVTCVPPLITTRRHLRSFDPADCFFQAATCREMTPRVISITARTMASRFFGLPTPSFVTDTVHEQRPFLL